MKWLENESYFLVLRAAVSCYYRLDTLHKDLSPPRLLLDCKVSSFEVALRYLV